MCQPETLSPADWGWIKEADVWKTCWNMLPTIATSCQELTKCGCKRECHGNCKANVIALASLVQHCAVAHAWTNTIIISHDFNWFVFSYVETNLGG